VRRPRATTKHRGRIDPARGELAQVLEEVAQVKRCRVIEPLEM
jgi:hypothetical protein